MVKKINCNKCNSANSEVIDGPKTINHPRYGMIKVELRQCNNCSHRYIIGKIGSTEFYL